MKQQAMTAESGQPTELTTLATTPGDLMFAPGMFERVEKMAEILSRSKAMVPQFLRNNPADCMAVVMKAAQWRMDPYAVAGKAYQAVQGGPIGYEAQLINAVIINNAPIKGRPKYSFFGNWDRIQGNVVQKTSQKQKKYSAPGWSDADESGVGVTVSVILSDSGEGISMNVLLKQCYPRNSTNWANDPQQQICYRAIQILARRHFPDVALGLYTKDEIETIPVKNMGEAQVVTDVDDLLKTDGDKQQAESKPEQSKGPENTQPRMATAEQRSNTMTAFQSIGILDAQVDEYLGKPHTTMTWDEYADLRQVYGAITKEGKPISDYFQMPQPSTSPEQIEQLITGADSIESLNDIEVLINTMPDGEDKDQVSGMLAVRRMEFEKS